MRPGFCIKRAGSTYHWLVQTGRYESMHIHSTDSNHKTFDAMRRISSILFFSHYPLEHLELLVINLYIYIFHSSGLVKTSLIHIPECLMSPLGGLAQWIWHAIMLLCTP